MRPSEIAKRLTGISTPLGGVQWQAATAEVTVARRVVRFLEDRRVLFNPGELESPGHCVDSVIEIRRFLTEELGNLDGAHEPLTGTLTGMRAACRKFLDTAHAVNDNGGFLWTPNHHNGTPGWRFDTALGELCGIIGIHLARLAAHYKLDVEDDLATIIPELPLESWRVPYAASGWIAAIFSYSSGTGHCVWQSTPATSAWRSSVSTPAWQPPRPRPGRR